MKNNRNEQSMIVLGDASERESAPSGVPLTADDSLSFLLSMIFKMAWPVWKRYGGNVPELELEQLEKSGDWPRGLALPVMQRISRDADLRKQLEERISRDADSRKQLEELL